MINFNDKQEFLKRLNELQEHEAVEYFCPDGKSLAPTMTSKFLGTSSLLVTGYAPLVIDDNSCYDLLWQNLSTLNNNYSFYDLIRCIQKSVFDYFGYDKLDEESRLETYKLCNERDINTSIENFKGTGNSWCLERASLCHNFLKVVGINSTLISNNIELNGNRQLHCYNVFEIENKYYLLDLLNTPLSQNNIPEPILKQIHPSINKSNNATIIEFENNYSYEFYSRSGKKYNITYICNNNENIEEQ